MSSKAPVVRELRTRGRVDRGYLRISTQQVTPELGKTLGVTPAGEVLVTSVESQRPAAQALQIGDVLQKIGSAPVSFATQSGLTMRLAA
jgi:S1-C subfamily serine protease